MTNLIITDNPAQEAGEQISNSINRHEGDTLCLLAGGSALDIIAHITLNDQSECRTIFMTGDERVSGEATVNNYLQIKQRYSEHQLTTQLVETVPETSENEIQFAERIEQNFFELLTTLNNPKIIFILGIGADGHTAGIFPMEPEVFRQTYQDDRTYVPVHVEGLRIDSRASFTPAWILNNANEVIGYAVGQSKRQILHELNQTDKKIFERPAELLKLHKNSFVYTNIDIT